MVKIEKYAVDRQKIRCAQINDIAVSKKSMLVAHSKKRKLISNTRLPAKSSKKNFKSLSVLFSIENPPLTDYDFSLKEPEASCPMLLV